MDWVVAMALGALVLITVMVIRSRRAASDEVPFLLDQTEQWRRMRERQRRE